MTRIVRCTIEMDLIDGEHFNPNDLEITDAEARHKAKKSFISTLLSMVDDLNLADYVQTRVVEENS